MKMHRTVFLLALFTALIYSCYPEGAESNSDYDLIISAYEPEYNFGNASTFVMPDTLVLLNDSTATDLIDLTEEQKQAFLNAVRDNLLNYGWTDSTESDTAYNPDALVLVSAIVASYTDTIWNAWKWYENFENINPLGIDSRYPWDPIGFPYIKGYTRGSLLITMLNNKNISANNLAGPLIWIGSLDGIISSKTVSTSNVVNSIDKLFELSDNPLNHN